VGHSAGLPGLPELLVGGVVAASSADLPPPVVRSEAPPPVPVPELVEPSGLQLWTFQINRRAQQFYERHGFAAVEWTDGSANEEREPDVRYMWPGRMA
jgi:hypothetical protein